jgi:hypothetical protein
MIAERGYTEGPESLDLAEWRAHLAALEADPKAVPDYEDARAAALTMIAKLENPSADSATRAGRQALLDFLRD